MDGLSGHVLDKVSKDYGLLFTPKSQKDALQSLRQQPVTSLLQGLKDFHDSVHQNDSEGKSLFISELVIDQMNEEQIWQQEEMQTEAARTFLHEQFTLVNLEQAPIQFSISSSSAHKKINGQTTDSKNVNLEDDHDHDNDDDDDDGSDDMDDDGGDEGDEAESEESDEELTKIKERLGNEDDFGLFGGSDDDLFKGAEKEWREEEEEEGEENDFDFELPVEKLPVEKKGAKKTQKQANKRKTEVDDQFFKMAEMEEFLDREDQKEARKQKGTGDKGDDDDESENEDNDEKLDMFSTWPDEETGKDAVYADFFDPPADAEDAQERMDVDLDGAESEENGSEEEMDSESDDDELKGSRKTVRFSDGTKAANEEESGKSSVSTFEKRTEKLRRQIQALEEKSVAEKPWQLMGEVKAADRPENSMLEEHVDFRQAPPTAAEMTEERSKSIEDIILQRVRDKAFDDNVRQVRPTEEAFELKTQRVLSQEKSKLSLHEVYEQEFLKLQAPEEEEEEKTNPAHDEIKKMMKDLFPCLDALASWHYTPLQPVVELRVKNNVSSVRMEEPTPITMSNATVLAPEEVQAKKKGELKGKMERTKEDKHRGRKQKKAAKRQRVREKEKRQKEVEKQNPGLGNKYSKERAMKELEKEAKGTIEVIKGKKSKKTSSKSFFSQLQDEVTSQTTTRAKKLKQKSSHQFML